MNKEFFPAFTSGSSLLALTTRVVQVRNGH